MNHRKNTNKKAEDMNWQDKIILLTGGTGSFGEKFTKITLREYNPKTIRIYSRG